MAVRLKVVSDLSQNDPGLHCCESPFQGLLEEIGRHNRG
jgi:hypothetical protein